MTATEELFVNHSESMIVFFRRIILFGFLAGILITLPLIYYFVLRFNIDRWILLRILPVAELEQRNVYDLFDVFGSSSGLKYSSSSSFSHAMHPLTHCDNVLLTYHIIRTILFFLQFPFRLSMYRTLGRAQQLQNRQEVINACTALCRSKVWKVSQFIGVIGNWCFVFIAVFTFRGSHCGYTRLSTLPWLYPLAVAHIGLIVLYLGLSAHWMREVIMEDAFEASSWKRGLDPQQLSSCTQCVIFKPIHSDSNLANNTSSHDLALRFTPNTTDLTMSPSSETFTTVAYGIHDSTHKLIVAFSVASDLSCPICMTDFEEDVSIRILPCSHYYHMECIDHWLSNKDTCPLCNGKLDVNTNFRDDVEKKMSGRSSLRFIYV